MQYHGAKERGHTHARDYTLQYLGYSTDNGAFYYYHTEAGKNYQETMLDVARYHEEIGLPSKWLLMDSWWYYKGADGGVKNWTARPDIFPNGTRYVAQETGWKMQAHNRYWATDNDYRALFPFTCGAQSDTQWATPSCLPDTLAFWNYLFEVNEPSDWGLAVYEQDWISASQGALPMLLNNTFFARQWMLAMAKAALAHGVSVQSMFRT